MSRSLAAGAIAALAVTVVVPSAGAADRLLAPVGQCPGQSAPGASPGTQEAAMRCLVRYARRAAGLRVGRAVAQLDRSAQGKADLIARCHVMEHDACGRPWNGVFRAAGYNRVGRREPGGWERPLPQRPRGHVHVARIPRTPRGPPRA